MTLKGSMFDLRVVYKTGFNTRQKPPNIHRKFRTKGQQTSFLGAVTPPEKLFVYISRLIKCFKPLAPLQI